MQAVMSMPAYDCFTINVPHIESKKFKAIIKAFGFDFNMHKMTPLERSMQEEKEGKVCTYASLDDLIKEFE